MNLFYTYPIISILNISSAIFIFDHLISVDLFCCVIVAFCPVLFYLCVLCFVFFSFCSGCTPIGLSYDLVL